MGGDRRYRILVAEDDEAYVGTLAEVLAADGRFELAGHARNGRDAVELARRLHVDAVLMDIEMPLLDGVEATRLLRDEDPELPVIAISGHDYEERVLEIRQAGANDYVRKARVAEELPAVLAAALGSGATRARRSASRRG